MRLKVGRALKKTVVGAATGFAMGGPFGAAAGAVAANTQKGKFNFGKSLTRGAIGGGIVGAATSAGLAGKAVTAGKTYFAGSSAVAGSAGGTAVSSTGAASSGIMGKFGIAAMGLGTKVLGNATSQADAAVDSYLGAAPGHDPAQYAIDPATGQMVQAPAADQKKKLITYALIGLAVLFILRR